MRILAIETSCDETAISIIEVSGDFCNAQFNILSNVVLSQVKLHKEYGGVYPSLAKREHSRTLVPVLKSALEQACGISNFQFPISNQFSNKTISKLNKILEREQELLKQFLEEIPKIEKSDTCPVRDNEGSQCENSNGIDAIAVTYGPGLEPALWVGINFAKALSFVWNVPIIPVNHMEGHLASVLLPQDAEISNSKFPISKKIPKLKIQKVNFPALGLLVSGGHTELILIKNWGEYEKIGQTRDDAAGEAFDKVARILGLPYPGGPQISALAEKAQRFAQKDAELTLNNAEGARLRAPFPRESASSPRESASFRLPRPMLTSENYDFSFSGLKTAVLYMVKKIPKITSQIKADIAKEFQQAVIDVLVTKTIRAAKTYNVKTIILAGGVAANNELREQLKDAVVKTLPAISYKLPTIEFTGDNAAMIAVAGYFTYIKNGAISDNETLSARGNLSF